LTGCSVTAYAIILAFQSSEVKNDAGVVVDGGDNGRECTRSGNETRISIELVFVFVSCN